MSIKLWKYILQAKDLCERLYPIKNAIHGNFLVVQWLRFHTYYQGSRFNLWSGSWDPENHLAPPKKKSVIHISNSVREERRLNMEYKKTFSNIKLSFDCSHLLLLHLLSSPSKHCPCGVFRPRFLPLVPSFGSFANS